MINIGNGWEAIGKILGIKTDPYINSGSFGCCFLEKQTKLATIWILWNRKTDVGGLFIGADQTAFPSYSGPFFLLKKAHVKKLFPLVKYLCKLYPEMDTIYKNYKREFGLRE